MKTYRQAFEEDYQTVQEPCDNRRGWRTRYVYIGNWHVWEASQERIRAVKRLVAMAEMLSVAIFLLGALAHSSLNWNRWVGLFSGLGMAAILIEAVGVVQFCAAKERLPRQYFNDINTKLKIATPIHAILLALAALAAILAMTGGSVSWMDAVVPLCFFASALASVTVLRLYRSLPQGIRKNDVAGAAIPSHDP